MHGITLFKLSIWIGTCNTIFQSTVEIVDRLNLNNAIVECFPSGNLYVGIELIFLLVSFVIVKETVITVAGQSFNEKNEDVVSPFREKTIWMSG